MKRFLKGVRSAEAVIAGLFLVIMTVVTFVAAVNRFTLKIPMPWSEELVRFLLVWDSIIAAAYGLSVNAHVGIDIISSKINPKARKIMKIVTAVFAIVFLAVMFHFGLKTTINSVAQRSPAMQISMAFVNASLPVGALFMVIEFVVIAVDSVKQLIKKEEEK